MHDPAQFDAFYAASRSRLLLQAYALTGDLPAARSAVRDAFVAAWHHWRKVSRMENPEDWVRPHAWSHAQRRHTARIWHRDKSLDAESRATLDALSKLTLNQRKVLLLTQLSSVSMEQMAREVGLTDETAARELQTAVSQFAVHRDVPSTAVRQHLEALEGRISSARFPRTTIVRRAGAARRRTHTAVGMAACVGALLLAGTVVHQTNGVSPGLGDVSAHGRTDAPPEPDPHLRVRDLLRRKQVGTLSAKGHVSSVSTKDNTGGNGINVICQPDRFADPEGIGALVRTFRFTGRPATKALQTVELSASPRIARRTYRETVNWFAGCHEERVQLLSTHRIEGTGDQAALLVLRAWKKPVATFTIGVSRTGSLVTTTVRRTESAAAPKLAPMARLTRQAVRGLCDHEQAGACTTPGGLRAAPPPATTRAPGFLQVVDLPPVVGISWPWIGTDPVRPRTNPAATRCDNADFTGKQVRRPRTRSFLIPQSKAPKAFGVTETLGRFRTAEQARDFVGTIRKRMAGCEDEDLATTLRQVRHRSGKRTDLTIWNLRTEVSDDRTVEYRMAILRRGRVVVQLGFVPMGRRTVQDGAFGDLAERALDRVTNLP